MSKESRIDSLLLRIEEAIVLILDQTKQIKSFDDFLGTSHGMFVLGGVCMQLIFIGESVKVISSIDSTYLRGYPDMPWNEIMGLRNIIAHEYHRIDAEEIFNVIKDDLPNLLGMIRQMKSGNRR